MSQRKKEGGHEEGPRNGESEVERTCWLNKSKSQRGGSLTPCCPPPWPAPFGRSPEDAVSAARARSGALGSKASGGTLGGRQVGDHRATSPPRFNRGPSSTRSDTRKEGGVKKKGGPGAMQEQRREPQGPAGVCDPSGSPGYRNQFNSKQGKSK